MTITLFRHCLPLLLALGAAPAWSIDEPKLGAPYDQCVGKAGSATFALMECEGAEMKRQDKRLNAAYRALLTRLSTSKAEELRKVQRAWLAYADAKCAFLFDNDDFNGQLDRIVASHCAVVERARRAVELEILAEH